MRWFEKPINRKRRLNRMQSSQLLLLLLLLLLLDIRIQHWIMRHYRALKQVLRSWCSQHHLVRILGISVRIIIVFKLVRTTFDLTVNHRPKLFLTWFCLGWSWRELAHIVDVLWGNSHTLSNLSSLISNMSRQVSLWKLGSSRNVFLFIDTLSFNQIYRLLRVNHFLELPHVLCEARNFLILAITELNTLEVYLLVILWELECRKSLTNLRLILGRKMFCLYRHASKLLELTPHVVVKFFCLCNEKIMRICCLGLHQLNVGHQLA